MNERIKACIHSLSIILVTSTVTAGLLVMFDTAFQPVPAAAHNLENSTLEPAGQTPLTRVAPPVLPLLQASNVTTIYLPLIFRGPTVVYFDDFSDDDSGWPTGDDGNCDSRYEGNRYRLDVNLDDECFRFAPKKAERTYGWFEATIYHSEGESNSAYGIYLNGQGGDNYYLFRIWPNNSCSVGGTWEFIRKRNGTTTTLLNVACDNRIIRDYGATNANTLRVQHNSGGQIVLFINGTQVASAFNDGLELTGTGTGIYARASSSKDIVVKAISFTVLVP